MQVSIRKAELSDAESLRRLSIDSFVNAYAVFNTKEDMEQYLAENFSEKTIAEELVDPNVVFLVAMSETPATAGGVENTGDNSHLVGYVKLNLSRQLPGSTRPLEIARLYTDTKLIGQGIGAQILRAVEKFAYDNNFDSVCLDVWQKNYRAVNFYQREGFSICGTTQFKLGNDIQDDFIMIKKLILRDEIVLETERLYLRKFEADRDAPYFYELLNSPGWLKYIGDRKVYTVEAAKEYLENRVIKHFNEHGYGSYAVVEKSSLKSIGNAGLFKRPHLDHPDIGYAFLPGYHGKGYAYEASLAVKEYAKKLGIPKLYGVTVAYNERSVHLLTKLGLAFEKTFRIESDPEELCLYAINLKS